MAENPSNRNPLETDETLSSTGGLPSDFFDVPESPASDRHAQSLPARDAPLPPRFAGAPASPRVVIERRASLPVVLVVIAGNIVFFLGGGLAGWAAARKGAARAEPPAPAATNSPLSEVVRALDAKASKSALDALSSRIGEVQSELGTLKRELARLEDRLNATTNAPPAQTAPPAPPDLTPLQTRIDDLVKEGQKLSPLPATFQSLRQRVDELDNGLNALRTEVAAVPKQIDASLNALKDAMISRPAPDQVSPADIGRNLGAALFREGKYAAAREVFLALIQNDSNDARLWYFAALANGLTSGDWTGESERMVRRGLGCEQGGKPKRSDIDAQFSTLTREKGKDWLEEWRKRASR
jgi:tetratricopeptide (TPR) repeat protein